MIVKRTNLASVFNMHYLRQCLKGEAKGLLDELPAGGDDFESAWKIVNDYYNNERFLVDKFLAKLFFMNRISRESASEISKLCTNTKNIVQELKKIGSPTEH